MTPKEKIDGFIQMLADEVPTNECSGEKDALEFIRQIDRNSMSPEMCTYMWCVANNQYIYTFFTFNLNNFLEQENIDKAKEANQRGNRNIYYTWFCDFLKSDLGFDNTQIKKLMSVIEKIGSMLYYKHCY